MIETSPYELVARVDGRRRAGALLRVTFEDGVRGYADVHPWPSLGDATLDDELSALAQGSPERIGARSLSLARSDGEARAAGRSLFEGLTVPPSHLSLPYGFVREDLTQARRQGYQRVKLKGWDFSKEEVAAFRESGLLFRLDFNARLAFEDVARLLDRWGDLGWVDWLEDPCPYDAASWGALRQQVRVAIDFEEGNAFDVRVVKPAREETPEMVPLEGRKGEPWGRGLKSDSSATNSFAPHPQPLSPGGERGALAFTTYLDHPVGQLGAAWTAAQAVADGIPVEIGGLVTHEVYEPNEFSRQLGVRDARLVPPGGLGLGYERELEALEWRRLEA